jgi:phage terminase large subunit
MLTFVRDEKGKPCAKAGAHDDCVMAMAITYYVRSQQSMRVQQKKKRTTQQYDSVTGY